MPPLARRFDCFMSLVLPGCSAKSVEPLYREQTTAGTQWTMGLLRAFWTGVVPEEWCVVGASCACLHACA